MQWVWVDLAIIAVIGLSVLTGLIRGFVKEAIALCVWILAIWLAYHYSGLMEPLLLPYIKDPSARKAVGFVVILIATLIAGAIFNGLFGYLLKRSGLSGTDRLLGMAFGFVRGLFIVALVMLVFKLTDIPLQPYVQDSRFFAKFDPLVSWMEGIVSPLIKNAQSKEQQAAFLGDLPGKMELATGV